MFLDYIKQIDSMLPCVRSVIDQRRRVSVTHSAFASCATFLFFPHFNVICDLSVAEQTHGNMESYQPRARLII